MTVIQQVLDLLRDHIGEVVTTDQLMAATGGKSSTTRRLRDLRRGNPDNNTMRYDIDTFHSDPSLMPDEYRLNSLDPLPPLPAVGSSKSPIETVRTASRSEQLAILAWLTTLYGFLTQEDIDKHLPDG